MQTKTVKINSRKPETNRIKTAARIIKSGGLVAFPTETVYGLGANALDASAVKKIFAAKERPFDDPLIIHIADIQSLNKLAKNIPKEAIKLAEKFWPGPLTMIFKKSALVPDITTAGLKTVAIRMPKNNIALELIKVSNTPIAAPSANTFSRPSPTTARHVFDDLKNKIPLIIDGGQTEIGLESTVIDLTSRPYTILRPGKITKENLEKILDKVEIHSHKNKKIKSPGMKYKHYSPKAKVILIYGKITQKIIDKYKNPAFGGTSPKIAIIKSNKNVEALSKNLFKKFREFDNKKIDIIIVESVPEKGLGAALMNRIKKAASEIVCPRGESNSHGLPH